MAERGDELERFKRRLERLRLHHSTCERRFSQSSAMQGQDTVVESTTQGQDTMVESTTQLDVIREESADDFSESELSSHADLDPEYNPTSSSSLSSDEVESPGKARKISREDLKGADTVLSDQPKGKSSLKQQIFKTYGKKDQKRYKKEKVSTTLSVKTCTKREDNKRAWDKRHYCLYCGQSNLKIARHLERKHMEIKDVAYAFSFPVRSEERKVLLEQLRNKGDFKHNSKVLEEGKGQLVTWKQPTDKVSVKDYLPCQYCLGMFSKKDLWRHQLSCRCKKLCVTDDVKKARGSVQSHAARLLPIASSSNGCQGIINGMRQDDVSFYIRSDSLICKYGESLYAKHGRMKSRHQYISQRMRELGQFMLVAKEMDKTVMGLEDLCTPSKFNLVVSIAKRLTEFSPRKNEYGKPSKAVKIGFCLKGAVAVLIGQTLMNDDELAEKRAKKFLELLERNWKNSVSVSAHQSIEEKRWNKQDDIPLTKDVKALMDHLRQVEDEAKEELSKWMSLTAYKTLNEAVLAQVIVFNKRREGEASRLSLEAYKKAGTNPINKDIYESLSPLEKQLSKLLTRVEVRGKRGRKVPVFLTERMKESIEILIKCRAEAGVPVENPYLFARPGVMTNIRGCDCLRKYAKESKAENPELLRSTKLRKQVATLCQLLDLSEQELEQVARFMGHDIRVHRDFYRQTDKTFQIAKISKLLFAMEQDTRSLTGKNLDTLAVSVGENSSTSTCETVPHRKGKRDREVDEDEGSEHHNKKSRHSRRDEDSDTDDEGSGQSPGTSPVKSSQKMTTHKRTKTKKAAGEGSDHCVKKRCYSRRDDSGSDIDDQSPETSKRHSREKKMGEQTTVLNVAVHPGVKLKKPWSE
ncbi:nucleoporin p54 isoform X1, partial [Clarias magur]